jgi:hypothetical protein
MGLLVFWRRTVFRAAAAAHEQEAGVVGEFAVRKGARALKNGLADLGKRGARRNAFRERDHPLVAQKLAPGSARLGDPVGRQEKNVAGRENDKRAS